MQNGNCTSARAQWARYRSSWYVYATNLPQNRARNRPPRPRAGGAAQRLPASRAWSPALANDGAPVQLGPGAPQRLRKRRVDGLHRGGRSRSAASKQRPRRARLAGPATSSNGVSPQTQLREPPVLSVHCCAGYATIYTVASGHKEATINARRAEMLYMAACRVLRDRAAAPSQSVWASSAAQIRSMAQIGLACSHPEKRSQRSTVSHVC